jgi:hypothetical protein
MSARTAVATRVNGGWTDPPDASEALPGRNDGRMAPGRSGPTVRISCVAEARPPWRIMVENLAITLRNYGGSLATAPLRACFVGECDSPLLDSLGVESVVVEPYPGVARTTNKLRMFEAFAAKPDADLLLALDCDVVVVGDLAEVLPADQLAMMPAVSSPLTAAHWFDLLTFLDLPVSAQATTLQSGEVLPAPYFNSGVLSLPSRLSEPLLEAWEHYVGVLDDWATDPLTGPPTCREWPHAWLWGDQLALSAALLATGIEVQPLDPALNLSTSLPWRQVEARFAESPLRLVHYHDRFGPAGELFRTDSPVVNAVIDDVNRLLAARTGRRGRGRLAVLGHRLTGRSPRDPRQPGHR